MQVAIYLLHNCILQLKGYGGETFQLPPEGGGMKAQGFGGQGTVTLISFQGLQDEILFPFL
jgi:hypothetical protein